MSQPMLRIKIPADAREWPARMDREVCGGRLWYPACQDANSDLPQALPENFADAGA